MSKKYHIFIGTTLDDLKNERRELPRIIMELGHIPVTSDYLDPEAKNAKQLVNKIIEECDYFVALTAHRYCPAGEKTSLLEEECAFASAQGIPVIGLIIGEKARWKAAKKEKEAAQIKKLEAFKKKLQGGVYETWLNAADLAQKFMSLLIQETSLNPRTGWVPADQAVEPAVANELSRLSVENEMLRRQIKIESGEIVTKIRDQMKHAIKILALNKINLSFYYTSGDNWENTRQFRLIRLFKLLVPELSLGKTTAEISRFLGTVLNPDLEKTVRKDYPTPSNTIKKIMADLALLKLVKYSSGGSKGGADSEVWEITEYGKELFSAYRMRHLEKVFHKKS